MVAKMQARQRLRALATLGTRLEVINGTQPRGISGQADR
tara:strand:- start:407 stop:523 length:117 start_codon:yes stop_codon:yes gene_type:complete